MDKRREQLQSSYLEDSTSSPTSLKQQGNENDSAWLRASPEHAVIASRLAHCEDSRSACCLPDRIHRCWRIGGRAGDTPQISRSVNHAVSQAQAVASRYHWTSLTRGRIDCEEIRSTVRGNVKMPIGTQLRLSLTYMALADPLVISI